MAGIKIFCPACGSVLKLPDRKFLGKKARCGKCSRSFIAYEPDPADFPQAIAHTTDSDLGSGEEPVAELVGVAARWIPDSDPAQEPNPSPPRAARVVPALRESPLIDVSLAVNDPEPGVGSRVRRKKSNWLPLAVTALTFTTVIGVGWFLFRDKLLAPPSRPATSSENSKAHFAIFGEKDPNAGSDESAIVSPTHGKPISLRYVPSGARILINLHPSALWTSGGRMEEFRSCCGPLATWIEKELKTLCLDDPSKIEELLIALIPSEKGQPPEVSAVVHLAKPLKRSQLLERFKGRTQQENPRHTYFLDQKHIYLLVDDRTYAIGPRLMEAEFLLAADNDLPPVEALDRLLQRSDRDRHITIAFETVSVQLDAPFLVPPAAQPLLQGVLDWFGGDVVSGVWSLHLAPDFHSEILLRNKSDKNPERLHRQLYKKMDGLPREVLALVEPLQPATLGTRKVVGRFPAMTSAFALSTRMEHDDRLVALRTQLPERAAPNLALGAMLTMDEFNRVKSAAPRDPKAPTAPTAPEPTLSIAQRLSKKIDVDFRNHPLYQALDLIGEDIGVKFKIEGNDLKMVGVTGNMKQQFKMDGVPATEVLDKMLSGIGLAIVIDEGKQIVTVTSMKAVQERGLKMVPIKQAKP